MRPLAALAAALLLCLASPIAALAADEKVPAPAAAKGPTVVTLGFHIFDVRDVELKGEKFYCDFYMWMRFKAPQDPEAAKDVEKLEFMNGQVDTREELDRKKIGDVTYICWRISGTFHFSAKLQKYPFDTQRLEIVIEHPSLEVDQVVYQDDVESYKRSGLRPQVWGVTEGLDIPEFSLREIDRRPLESVYRTDFGDISKPAGSCSTYSRFVVAMRFARDFWPYFFKIIIPLIVIMAMAYLVFFLPAKEIQTASGLAITALLSCIAFNITVSQNLPEVGYLVVSDKFFLSTYILLFLTLLQSVLTYAANDAGKDVGKWDRLSRILFPVLYIGVFAYLLSQALAADAPGV